MDENIKVSCEITKNRVPKKEVVIPKNQWVVEILFRDVRESETSVIYTASTEKELNKILALLTVLNGIKKRLLQNWNKYCNREAYEFDDVIEELGLSDVVNADDLWELPHHMDYGSILGRIDSCSIVYYDDKGEDYICEVKYL